MNERFVANGYHLSTSYNKTFMKVFEQNYNGEKSNMFVDNSEANFSLKRNKFSVLKFIDDNFRISTNNHFEFILYYKELNLIHHFSQNWSIHSTPVNGEYSPLHTTNQVQLFVGLGPSNNDQSFIDGEVLSTDWWYCIGAKEVFKYNADISETVIAGIPGPIIKGKFTVVNGVSLWLRLENIELLDKFPRINKACTYKRASRSISTILMNIM